MFVRLLLTRYRIQTDGNGGLSASPELGITVLLLRIKLNEVESSLTCITLNNFGHCSTYTYEKCNANLYHDVYISGLFSAQWFRVYALI